MIFTSSSIQRKALVLADCAAGTAQNSHVCPFNAPPHLIASSIEPAALTVHLALLQSHDMLQLSPRQHKVNTDVASAFAAAAILSGAEQDPLFLAMRLHFVDDPQEKGPPRTVRRTTAAI